MTPEELRHRVWELVAGTGSTPEVVDAIVALVDEYVTDPEPSPVNRDRE